MTKILVRWEQLLCASLDTYTLEENLIDFYASHNDGGFMRGGLILQKTKILLDPDNTPFRYITLLYRIKFLNLLFFFSNCILLYFNFAVQEEMKN